MTVLVRSVIRYIYGATNINSQLFYFSARLVACILRGLRQEIIRVILYVLLYLIYSNNNTINSKTGISGLRKLDSIVLMMEHK